MDEWFRVDVQYVPSEREIVWARLYRHECLGLEETGPGASRAYYSWGSDRDSILTNLRNCSAVLEVTASIVAAEDWHSRWMESYHSFRVGPFMIRPSWEPALPKAQPFEVVVDPQGAFGTGTHETTQLCLRHLPGVAAGRRSAIDLGCGSGILSIALCKLAPELRVLAMDHDLTACQVCRENREANRVWFSIACGEISATRGYFDLIVANLQMDSLLKLLPEFLDRSSSGTLLLLSGLLEEQIGQFRQVYDAALALQHIESQGEWAALVYLRP